MNMNTNTETVKHDWNDIKSKIKSRFGKLSDPNIELAKENLDLLKPHLQSAYGYGKDQAEKELTQFKASLETDSAPTENAVDPKAVAPKEKVA